MTFTDPGGMAILCEVDYDTCNDAGTVYAGGGSSDSGSSSSSSNSTSGGAPKSSDGAPKPSWDTSAYPEYNSLVAYTQSEMVINSYSQEAQLLKKAFNPVCGFVLAAGCKIYGYSGWAYLVRPGGPWDHKPIIASALGMYEDGDFRTPLPDGETVVSYEIWSNIHYGYVGTHIGISEMELHGGANVADLASNGWDGINPADAIAIQMGIDLRRRYKPNELTIDVVENKIMKTVNADDARQVMQDNEMVIPCAGAC